MFEQLCRDVALRCERVLESTVPKERRPDFRLWGDDGTLVIAEVKLVTPSRAEVDVVSRVRRGESVGRSIEPGERVRSLIKKANGQLRPFVGPKTPGVLCIFNPELALRQHTRPYCVLVAMRGFDTVPVTVPTDPSIAPTFGAAYAGPGKKMTPTSNTSTSAIIVPEQIDRSSWTVNVYHNPFASFPLPRSALSGTTFSHFGISAQEQLWQPIA